MKKIYLSIMAALAISSAATAQCGGRYDANLYSVTSTTNIAYGSNVTWNGITQTLTMDFYEPTGDVSTSRPLIIWVHGGSFVGGSKTDADVDTLCHRFVKKGYACASINYRTGVSSFDSLGFVPAIIRSVQDLKAAVRFFYKDKATGTNTYKIDTNNIFIGGSSAGAFTVLHYQYLDRDCEITTYISQGALDSLGGLDGASGNPGYSTKVNGVIDLCGALGVYGWLEPGNLPLCSMHGTADLTVPYNRGKPQGVMYADGSRMIYEQAHAIGVSDNFYTWQNSPHVPYSGHTATQIAYMDTTVNFVHDYLLQRLNISCNASQPVAPYGVPEQVATLYPFTDCATGIKNITANLLQEVYPNPSSSNVNVVFVNNNTTHTLQLTDISGRVISSGTTTQSNYILERGDVKAGVYFLKVSNTQGQSSVKKIIFN